MDPFAEETRSAVATLRQLYVAGEPGCEQYCVQFDPEDSSLAVGFADGNIRLYKASSGKLATLMLPSFSVEKMPVTCLKWKPSVGHGYSVLASTSADGYLAFWHATSGKCIFSIRDPGKADLFCLDYRNDGELIATGNKDGLIHLYDDATKSVVGTLEPHIGISPGHSNRVFSVKFADDPNMLVSGGWDSAVYFWDVRERKSVGWVLGPHLCSDALDIQGDVLLTGSYSDNDVLQLWSISQRKLIETVPWVQGPKDPEKSPSELGMLYTATFGHGKKYIGAGGAGLNEYKIFSRTGKHGLVAKMMLPKIVTASDFSHNNDMVALGCGDGNLRLYAIEYKTTSQVEL